MKPKNDMDLNCLKNNLLDLCYKNQLHHLGSYFSCLEILDEIYSKMNEDDIFILSNGHAVAALYVVLEKYFGFDAQELLNQYGDHPKLDEDHKIYCSSGSLGLGILVAVGRSLANKNRNTYCLISDGEAAEGSVWEALRFSYEQKIENLKIYVNANGYCAYDIVDLDYLEKRIAAFNPSVVFCRTNVNQFDFLEGLEAHYKHISAAEYARVKKL